MLFSIDIFSIKSPRPSLEIFGTVHLNSAIPSNLSKLFNKDESCEKKFSDLLSNHLGDVFRCYLLAYSD